ncbi:MULTISPECIES: hypothetical protein [unclassified Microcoleus]
MLIVEKDRVLQAARVHPVTLTIPAQDIFDNKSRSINYLVSSQIGSCLGF